MLLRPFLNDATSCASYVVATRTSSSRSSTHTPTSSTTTSPPRPR